jgi:hypothetical protein
VPQQKNKAGVVTDFNLALSLIWMNFGVHSATEWVVNRYLKISLVFQWRNCCILDWIKIVTIFDRFVIFIVIWLYLHFPHLRTSLPTPQDSFNSSEVSGKYIYHFFNVLIAECRSWFCLALIIKRENYSKDHKYTSNLQWVDCVWDGATNFSLGTGLWRPKLWLGRRIRRNLQWWCDFRRVRKLRKCAH